VHVKLRSGDEAELAGQLIQEGVSSPADVFYAENPPALTTLQEKGLLAPVDKQTLAAVPREVSSPTGDWVGVSARSAVFVANKSVPASTLPTSVLDLAGPVWKGRLGIAPGETDFSPVVTRVIKAEGQDAAKRWLLGLKTNAKVYASNEDLVAAVNRGEIDTGVIDHYYWYRLRDEVGAAKVKCVLHYFAVGDPGALVDVSGASVLASGGHKAAAQAFLAYLVSEPGQRIIATSYSYEYPLLSSVHSGKDLKPLASIGPFASMSDLGDGKGALALMQDVGLL
jgi:iron(III) transport system substrate-binding protein